MGVLRIAVADDEQEIRLYFHRMLPELGYNLVGSASNGEELQELCDRQQPNVVICDVGLGRDDGVTVTSNLYERSPTALILMSSVDTKELVDRLLVDRVMGFLVKPLKRSDLLPAIELAWRRFGYLREQNSTIHDQRQPRV